MSYGTFNKILDHNDLVWSYKQAFEAMNGVQYRSNDTFTSPMINILKMHHMRLKPEDFKKIPPKCIHSMLKHFWIFEEWTTEEIWQAVIFSLQSKQLTSRKIQSSLIICYNLLNRLERTPKKQSQIALLTQIVSTLTDMGHYLFPFGHREYSESIADQLSQPQILIYKKVRWVDDSSIEKSYHEFVRKFDIQTVSTKQKSELADLKIIGEILYMCYHQAERLCVIQKLWCNARKYKESVQKALAESDLGNVPLWDPFLTNVIADFL